MRYTKYERGRIIAARALQLAAGAQPLVKAKLTDPVKVARMEFEKGLIPLKVKRRLEL
jgi:DNA-directed RNA polymerase subunit K